MKLTSTHFILFALVLAIGFIIHDEYQDKQREKTAEIKKAETNIKGSENKVKDKEKGIDSLDESLTDTDKRKDKIIQDGKDRKKRIDTISDLDTLYNEVARYYQ